MKFLRRIIPWILVATVILAALYIPDLGPENYRDFDSLFRNERVRQGIAGYEVVIIKGGEIVFNKAYGFDGQRNPLDISTPLYMGPASEIFTGTLLAQLVNEKKITLDVPITHFIPELGSLKARTASGDSLDLPLTLRLLAAHRVAFPEKDLPEFDPETMGLEAGLPDADLFLSSHFPTEKYTRSRLSYRIVGTILEKASGMKYSELLESKIAVPLDMRSTTAEPSSMLSIAVGAGSFFGLTFPYVEKVPYDAAPSDGIVTTSEDLAKFLRFVVSPKRGQRIPGLSSAQTPMLYQPLYKDGDTGFGWRIIENKEGRSIFQGGSIRGYASRIVIYPERNAAIAILCPQDGVLISNFLLPKLVSCAEQILFEGESGRPFPTQRAQLVLGFIFIIYLLNIILQTLVSYSWARNLLKYRETGISQLYARFVILRTIIGLVLRILIVLLAPLAIGALVGWQVTYQEIIAFEPGVSTMLMTALLFGALRNIARLVMVLRLRHF
ncbi:MAG TPA: serine hydrolase domain-containing protein [Rectinema sp.]|jgi:CubicO group peptidase (beta-lactamase class C family)|nr:serine hydrolase domain-containing protein [Rectinema sp.]HOI99510.1 serine hydrolase domain-containing protein [Rectinema sp.]HQQ73035.1 serine hydrolase domain-containing protein [Rectinema sp.]